MASERLRWLLGAGAALVAGLALRLWFLHHAPAPPGDAIIYSGIARNLLLHGIYGFNSHISPAGHIVFEPTLIRLPGYPLFIALVFSIFGIDNVRAVLALQVVADLLTCLLAAALVRRIFGRRPALIVLWLAALCPFTANYTAVVLTETLVLFTIALTFYALFRWMEGRGGLNRWLWLTAIAMAASLLLRPEQGLFAAAVLPAILWFQLRGIAWGFSPMKHRPKEKGALAPAFVPALAFTLCIILPFIPWTIRNWRTFHLFQPLAPRNATDPGDIPPPAGMNHWYRTWALDFATTETVYWKFGGDRVDPNDLPNRAFVLGCTAPPNTPRQQLPLYAQTVALLADYNRTTFPTPALDQQFAQLAARRAAAEPLCNTLLLPVGRVLNMLTRPRLEFLAPDEWWARTTPPRQRRFAYAYAALNLAYLALAIWGLIRWLNHLRARRIQTNHKRRHPEPGGEAKNLTKEGRHPERAQRVEEPVLSEAKEPRGTSAPPQPHASFSPETSAPVAPGEHLISPEAISPEATILLASTIATVILRLALLLTLDNSEPRYTLEFFPIFFLWMAPLFTRLRSTPPGTRAPSA